MKIKYSEVLKDLKSAEEFCELNKIDPTEVIVLWAEEVEDEFK